LCGDWANWCRCSIGLIPDLKSNIQVDDDCSIGSISALRMNPISDRVRGGKKKASVFARGGEEGHIEFFEYLIFESFNQRAKVRRTDASVRPVGA
jgi:hypothetical protein